LTDKEYCLYFRKGAYCCPQSYEDAKTIWYQPINIRDKELFKHTTIKPLNIIETLVRNSSKKGDIVLDCFCGSGTTCVAAKELERHFLGFEISKKWCGVAENRLNKIDANGQISLFLN
jgi:DNA modification methylase